MIIQSGELSMNSSRRYTSSAVGFAAASANKAESSYTTGIFSVQQESSQQQDFVGTLNYQLDSAKKTEEIASPEETNGGKILRLKFQTLHYLLEMLFRKRAGMDGDTTQQQLSAIFGGSNNLSQGVTLGAYSSMEEHETTSFSTTGQVVTSDGREISFQVDVNMSRSFYQENAMYFNQAQADLCDPLVINMDVPAAQVTDQKFYFDLDCDGTKEYISTLGQGSGFLALDKNQDGEINDGSELFGVKSGDGFYDLSQYDSDGNGWIDEADPIFNELRIWSPDAQGKSQLYTLKDSGVGAICLYHVNSQFAMNDVNNQTNGMIRETGVFLKENGQASTIQHVDLAM